MSIKKLLLATTVVAGMATGASAATLSFETDEAGFVSVASSSGTQTGGAALGPFAGGGTTFTIDADTFTTSGTSLTLSGETNIEITQNNEGLGVDNNNGWLGYDNSDVDGYNGNDILVFTFAKAVKLVDIIFENVSNNDDFVFYTPGANPEFALFDIVNPIPFDTDGDEGIFNFGGIVLTSFGIGAKGSNDNFRLSKMNVSAVPLPAAGWLLVAGLGGLGALRRRKKAATA